jgi:hypothetical protein
MSSAPLSLSLSRSHSHTHTHTHTHTRVLIWFISQHLHQKSAALPSSAITAAKEGCASVINTLWNTIALPVYYPALMLVFAALFLNTPRRYFAIFKENMKPFSNRSPHIPSHFL